MRRTILIALMTACGTGMAAAENQVWTSGSVSKGLSGAPRIEIGLTADLRFQPDGDLQTVELRPGISYELTPALKVSGGYLWASTRQPGPDRTEHRLWQQLGYELGDAAGFEFEGRSRLEQRWRDGEDGTGWRLRQEFGVSRPLTGTPFSLHASTDLFFELNETAWGQDPGFSEARSVAAIGWQAAEELSFLFGYLNQHRPGRGGPGDTRHHLLIEVSSSF